MSNAIIRGGPSKQRLPNQAEIEAAAQALAQRSAQPYMKGVPTAPPPTPVFTEPTESAVASQLYAPEGAQEPPPLNGSYTIYQAADGYHVTIWMGADAYTGEGASVVEALSVAAGKLEEGLEAPRCGHCGQILPEHLREVEK